MMPQGQEWNEDYRNCSSVNSNLFDTMRRDLHPQYDCDAFYTTYNSSGSIWNTSYTTVANSQPSQTHSQTLLNHYHMPSAFNTPPQTMRNYSVNEDILTDIGSSHNHLLRSSSDLGVRLSQHDKFGISLGQFSHSHILESNISNIIESNRSSHIRSDDSYFANLKSDILNTNIVDKDLILSSPHSYSAPSYSTLSNQPKSVNDSTNFNSLSTYQVFDSLNFPYSENKTAPKSTTLHEPGYSSQPELSNYTKSNLNCINDSFDNKLESLAKPRYSDVLSKSTPSKLLKQNISNAKLSQSSFCSQNSVSENCNSKNFSRNKGKGLANLNRQKTCKNIQSPIAEFEEYDALNQRKRFTAGKPVNTFKNHTTSPPATDKKNEKLANMIVTEDAQLNNKVTNVHKPKKALLINNNLGRCSGSSVAINSATSNSPSVDECDNDEELLIDYTNEENEIIEIASSRDDILSFTPNDKKKFESSGSSYSGHESGVSRGGNVYRQSRTTKLDRDSNQTPYSKRNLQKRRRNAYPDLLATSWNLILNWSGIVWCALLWLISLAVEVVVLSNRLVIEFVVQAWQSTNLYYSSLSSFLITLWMKVANFFTRKGTENKSRDKKNLYSLESNIFLPTTGEEAMKRLLACRGKDPYSILGVTRNCTDDDIKKYYKRQAFLVHPDKNKQPGAEEAFKILAHAFEIIGEPEHRKDYDTQVAEKAQLEGAWGELASLLTRLREKLEEAANTIRCTNCNKLHKRIKIQRPLFAARQCADCQIRHASREGDIWAESSFMGLRWCYYACMEGAVYDISEWAACQSDNLMHLQANTHSVQYRIVSGKKNPLSRNTAPECPTDPELEEFFNNLCREKFGQDYTSHGHQNSGHAYSDSRKRKGRKRNKN